MTFSYKTFGLGFAATCLISELTWMRQKASSSHMRVYLIGTGIFMSILQAGCKKTEANRTDNTFGQSEMWVWFVLATLDFVIPALPWSWEMCQLAVPWKHCCKKSGFESCTAVICPQDKISFWVWVVLFKEQCPLFTSSGDFCQN